MNQCFIALGVACLKVKCKPKNNRVSAARKRNLIYHLRSFVDVFVQSCKTVGWCLFARAYFMRAHPTHIKHTNISRPPLPLRFPLSEFLQFHTATKNTGVSVPRVDRPWKRGCHIQRRSHGKREDPISGPLISNKPTVRPPNIAPTDVVQAWAEAQRRPIWNHNGTWVRLLEIFWDVREALLKDTSAGWTIVDMGTSMWDLWFKESLCSYYPNLL